MYNYDVDAILFCMHYVTYIFVIITKSVIGEHGLLKLSWWYREISLWLVPSQVSAEKQPQVPRKEPQRTAVARREGGPLEGCIALCTLLSLPSLEIFVVFLVRNAEFFFLA